MTRFGWAVVISVFSFLGIVLSIGIYAHLKNPIDKKSFIPEPVSTTTVPLADPGKIELYSNGEYGFTFAYPVGTRIETTTTTAIMSIASKKNIEITTAKVRLINAGVSVRVSSSSASVLSCTKVRPSETSASTTTFGGETWSIFTREVLGTDKELQNTSYRAIHDGLCVTLLAEQPYTKGVSSIRDDLSTIIRSFSFARP